MRIYHERALTELAKTQPEAAELARTALESSVKRARFGLRLTPTQLAQLQADAKAAGMTATDYVVDRLELGA
jgi:hypothetical protein